MTIKENQLESNQSYHARGVHGHTNHPPELEEELEGFICSLCTDQPVPDENTYCPACQAAEAEYREER